ncbi:hypothetical protein SAMD00019534_005730 [Acytostelium subglobosum LB1]|uniref:hypothetical protein n=1 Tax=Acytostelium subglobosum LB1 TaxID=1410327 RepID=UPI00064490D8|nr:hypothetical protein SAMD00019534_005730 [Acytostelium subglobosum LB1]GAM17398.1 hypothetical protein SAMD00019534_005730 [Acytostelium subglobosum LB1]|eukprot:XP_012759460.1 hypothetical protein SAMD00019534_005730 [Acytostelium subglobosum LB1]
MATSSPPQQHQNKQQSMSSSPIMNILNQSTSVAAAAAAAATGYDTMMESLPLLIRNIPLTSWPKACQPHSMIKCAISDGAVSTFIAVLSGSDAQQKKQLQVLNIGGVASSLSLSYRRSSASNEMDLISSIAASSSQNVDTTLNNVELTTLAELTNSSMLGVDAAHSITQFQWCRPLPLHSTIALYASEAEAAHDTPAILAFTSISNNKTRLHIVSIFPEHSIALNKTAAGLLKRLKKPLSVISSDSKDLFTSSAKLFSSGSFQCHSYVIEYNSLMALIEVEPSSGMQSTEIDTPAYPQTY